MTIGFYLQYQPQHKSISCGTMLRYTCTTAGVFIPRASHPHTFKAPVRVSTCSLLRSLIPNTHKHMHILSLGNVQDWSQDGGVWKSRSHRTRQIHLHWTYLFIQYLFTCCSATWFSQLVSKLPVNKQLSIFVENVGVITEHVHTQLSLAGIAERRCGSDGNWEDPPNVLKCHSSQFANIEHQVWIWVILHIYLYLPSNAILWSLHRIVREPHCFMKEVYCMCTSIQIWN